jgi:acyl carrier protein
VTRQRENVHALVAAMAPRPDVELTDDTLLATDLAYDSLRLIELSIALERRFGMSAVHDSAVANVTTVGEVVALVASHGTEV